jgi:uncharacterized protein (TIGR02996 family)
MLAGMSLAQASDAVDRQDLRATLEALLAAWRDRRSPAIADVIDLVSESLAAAQPKIEGKTRAAFQARWLEVASHDDAAELGPLLAVLEQEPCTMIRDRIDRLAVRPEDPRISRALVAFLARKPCPCTSTPNAPMWTQIWKLVTALRDVRARAALEEQAAWSRSDAFAELVRTRAMRALAALVEPAALSAADESLLARIAKQVSSVAPTMTAAPASTNDDELLQRIYDAPDDDAPRLVYADVLAGRGDPRGELITLQCQPAAKPKSRAQLQREKALIREHGRRWLGALEPVIGKDGLVYERGFVAACQLAFKTKTQRAQLLRHPEWATVRHLGRPEAALLAPPSALRSLCELDGVTTRLLDELAGVSLPAIRWTRIFLEEGEALDVVRVQAVLPALRSAALQLPKWTAPRQYARNVAAWSPTVETLAVELVIGANVPRFEDYLPLLPPTVRTFVLDGMIDWRSTATRTDTGWHVVCEPLASFARAERCRAMLAGIPERDFEIRSTAAPAG